MRVLLINPPYQTITSNKGVGHQVPLGLLMVGGALLDAGHDVKLLDAECRHLSLSEMVAEARQFDPQVVMTGHAGSTPAHPIAVRALAAVKAACPRGVSVYGGVYPTYHAESILAAEPAVDVIVRGEGEATAVELVSALAESFPVHRPSSVVRRLHRDTRNRGSHPSTKTPKLRAFAALRLCVTPSDRRRSVVGSRPRADLPTALASVFGIAYRDGEHAVLTPARPPVQNLDAYRVGWELVEDWDAYQCFGLGRAAIVQLSRGCPHRCTYCGQHGFWVKWRHRDPVALVDEIEWLYRTHDVRFCTLADENPTTLKPVWRRFLEELAARKLPVRLFATIRATDIVRDADILPLYRDAGILYVLMGIETTNPEVIQQVNKRSTTRDDILACRLLKQHGIFSILGHIVGFEEESWSSLRLAQRRLREYEADYLNAMYVTPHSWTEFARESENRPVVQLEQRKWDYRHQIFFQPHLAPWQLFAGVKWLELWFHLRPRKLLGMLRTRDPERLWQVLWTHLHTGRVWLAEIVEFLFATSFVREPAPLAEVQGERNVRTAAAREKLPAQSRGPKPDGLNRSREEVRGVVEAQPTNSLGQPVYAETRGGTAPRS